MCVGEGDRGEERCVLVMGEWAGGKDGRIEGGKGLEGGKRGGSERGVRVGLEGSERGMSGVRGR